VDFGSQLSTDGRQLPVFKIDSQDLHSTWHGRMFLKNIDLTTALRPSFLPDEVLCFVQDNVGLYEGYVCDPAVQGRAQRRNTDNIVGNIKSQTIKMAPCI
jgi:hypothetical protein